MTGCANAARSKTHAKTMKKKMQDKAKKNAQANCRRPTRCRPFPQRTGPAPTTQRQATP